jgi:thiol-disulfide isomerase/thioredoxin
MNKQKKTMAIVACSVAGTVMLGALVYYNFIDKPIKSGVEIGDLCPDFTVETFKIENGAFQTGGETFTLSEHKGEIVVVNFWATYCGPCIEELPEFDEFQKNYAEDVTVISIDGETNISPEVLAKWMNTNSKAEGWTEFDLTFGRYEKDNNVYSQVGFTSGALPGTMIINREGVIVYREDGAMSYNDLLAQIEPLLKL